MPTETKTSKKRDPRRAHFKKCKTTPSVPPPIPWTRALELHVVDMVNRFGVKQETKVKQENYLNKAVTLFRFIYDRCGGSTAQIPWGDLYKVSPNYRSLTNDLYNCNLIYFKEGKHGVISHGRDRKTKKMFLGTFQLARDILDECGDLNTQPRYAGPWDGCRRERKRKPPVEENLVRYRREYKKHLGIDTSSADKITPTELRALIAEIKKRYKQLTQGDEVDEPQYLDLMFDDGTPFKCGKPHKGRYQNGRVYNSLSCLKKEKRAKLTYKGNPLVELMDVKSCYMSIVASIARDQKLMNELMSSDIYNDCIRDMKLSCSRNDIKPYFQKYLLAKPSDLKRAMTRHTPKNSPVLMTAVHDYVKTNFPEAHAFVMSSPLIHFPKLDSRMRLVNKPVKSLVQTLQECETILISQIRSKCQGVTFTVHDSVLCDNPNQQTDFKQETQNLLFLNPCFPDMRQAL